MNALLYIRKYVNLLKSPIKIRIRILFLYFWNLIRITSLLLYQEIKTDKTKQKIEKRGLGSITDKKGVSFFVDESFLD